MYKGAPVRVRLGSLFNQQRDEARDMLIEQHRVLYQTITDGRAEDARAVSSRHIDYVQEVLAESQQQALSEERALRRGSPL
jgi:GntR family transcriptional repressor for pyruvate dehydrogenase complex